ncbi:MAG: hypothetical protein D5R99_02695 [Methanocalculus sp. MSAO_Arc1]|uniref:COG1361 S-layer family protein n=1 Tax=Methanocalculus TaxID=71151 RepID=UPI000FEE6190|nr:MULTISPECIES: hypothetical protein [unclassified Methanocalculus]MCP1661593.1 hypothetical protein [Methanocalculus sp. AMF5]RQD81326.1 MAG: hypothetical protein D5R99_02695 [Methanocalculus sp. MSAO_Arc1]
MRKSLFILVIGALLVCSGIGAASASQVGVIDVSLDPPVFFPSDTGTITVVIKNTGSNPVEISRINLAGVRNIGVVESPHYSGVGILGAGDSMTTSFTIRAGSEEGIFYPRFSMNFIPTGNFNYPVTVKVDRTPLEASITSRPDTFMEGRKDTVEISVGNPRDNSLSGVRITPATGVAEVVPTSAFIGTLNPGENESASFSVTPAGEGDLTFNVEYRNGQNRHTIPLTLSVVPGTAKRVAEPIVSNIEVGSVAGGYRITGDVSNAGLETARSVVMTTSEPAVPIDPFRLYVVGALDADDFSSFEVTFSAKDVDNVPLVIRYRDDDGNLYEETVMVAIRPSLLPSTADQDEGIPPVIIGIGVVSLLFVAGALLYSRKKR